MKKIRVGMLGCGSMGKYVIDAFEAGKVPNAEIAVVCVRTMQSKGVDRVHEAGIPLITDPAQLLDYDLDVVAECASQDSVIANGEFEGKTITELVEQFKGQLVGEKVYANTGNEFPLLIKFIDAKSDLSIQVHPDDELAAKRHNSKGKTEMWYVVGADEGAHLLSGLSEKITPEEYVKRVENNTITDVLTNFNVKAGDVFFLPAGRIHAIGTGCFIAEIQQTSDITYRIYDYGRLGLDGKPRELHTELAKDAIDYNVYPEYKTSYVEKKDDENVLVECKYFTTSQYDLDKPFTKDLSGIDSFLVVMCIEGRGSLTDHEDEDHTLTLHQGETVLIPATSKGVTFTPLSGMKLITSYIG